MSAGGTVTFDYPRAYMALREGILAAMAAPDDRVRVVLDDALNAAMTAGVPRPAIGD